MSVLGMCNQSVDVYRVSVEQNATGATRETWSLSTAGLQCRIRQLRAAERVMADQVAVEISHRLYCDATADLLEGDEIRSGDTIYRVQVVNDVDGAGHHLEVDLLERRPDRHGR